ncbi:MAG: metallophosphoesterase [Clostridia bacterium]|nr:metallophosphoesterase [Clostridia bacterium]
MVINMQLPKLFRTCPVVFAAGDDYQIMVPVYAQALFWVEIGTQKYYDHTNGIMVSDTDMHRVSVPQNVLDEAYEYTVVYRKIIDRKPYFPETEDEVRCTFAFHPVRSLEETDTIRFYHISDVHGHPSPAIQAGSFFGDDLDFLILNGDIIDHSGDTKNFEVIFQIAEALTHGTKPVICARGNHDMRGFCAERIKDYTPAVNGKTYYPVRLGSLYFILLDCAEDKNDDSTEYGHTVACHAFREEQTAYLKGLIAHANQMYDAPGIVHTFAVAHTPFTTVQPKPFDIEQDLYREWVTLLSENVHPDLLICGHMHKVEWYLPGSSHDHFGQTFPTVVAAEPKGDAFIGGAFTVTKDRVTVQFTDENHNVISSWQNN